MLSPIREGSVLESKLSSEKGIICLGENKHSRTRKYVNNSYQMVPHTTLANRFLTKVISTQTKMKCILALIYNINTQLIWVRFEYQLYCFTIRAFTITQTLQWRLTTNTNPSSSYNMQSGQQFLAENINGFLFKDQIWQ